jgi:hypothetical protein
MLKSRGIKWAGPKERIGDIRNDYKILVGKPKGTISGLAIGF